LDKCAAAGIDKPVVPGLTPIHNFAGIVRFAKNCDANIPAWVYQKFDGLDDKPEEALKEMYRILKPGGKIFLSDYLEHKNKKLVDEMHDLWFGFSKLQLEEYLKKSSFKNIKYEKLDNKLKNDLNIIIVTALK
jgi:SAM-dependent methyltransferase